MVVKIVRCPKCASKDVSAWSGAGAGAVLYMCKYCGYSGPKVVEEFKR